MNCDERTYTHKILIERLMMMIIKTFQKGTLVYHRVNKIEECPLPHKEGRNTTVLLRLETIMHGA